MSPMFLGLDASTQALKASLLTSTLDVRKEVAVNFDADLPHYKTKGGVHHGPDGQVNSPVEMVIEAFDLLFGKMKEQGWPLGDVMGVAAAGQQHASVYWNQNASTTLGNIDPSKPLLEQMKGAFSRPVIPNWQDSSTTAECRAIESAVGGAEQLAEITGSKAHERFTGPQIMRWIKADPDQFKETSRISLVSSYITTLLCLDGEVKGIDESDVCGMNMWTMNTPVRGWNGDILKAIAGPDAEKLKGMLGEVERDGGRPVGTIGNWFVKRWGFNKECLVFSGTGDNPATFLSLTLRPSEGLISLGTSDVVLVSTRVYAPNKEYHAFFHPAQIPPDQGGSELRYFNMLVYKNGSLAREHVRDQYFDKSWDKFNDAVNSRRPKSADDLPKQAGFYWLLPDIIPTNAYGTHKYISSPTSTTTEKVLEFADPDSNALSILETQFLSYASRTGSILDEAASSQSSHGGGIPRLSRVYATGGASANTAILSLAADIFGSNVCKNVEYEPETGWVGAHWNACSVGMAYKARWGYERTKKGKEMIQFDELIHDCREERRIARKEHEGKDLRVDADVDEGVRIVARPGKGSEAYAKSIEWWAGLEKRALAESEAAAESGKVNGH